MKKPTHKLIPAFRHLSMGLFALSVLFSFASWSNEVKKVKDDRAMVQFSTIQLKKGDLVEITDVSGKVTGTGKVTALKGDKAIIKLNSGEDDIRPGDKFRLPPAPFETTDHETEEETNEENTATYRKSSLSYSERKFHLGGHLGYSLPQFKSAKNALSYGLLFGYRMNEKLDFSFNVSSFSYNSRRFILPFLRGAYAPFQGLPLFFGAGAGASYFSVSGFSTLDFGAQVFTNYEYSFSPELSLAPELTWSYLFPVDSKTLNGYSILEIALRLRYYF